MKPYSLKTLLKKYEEARITDDEKALLHRYFLCFSNLYGLIDMKTLWKIFKNYNEKISQKKFYDFVDIVQREENPYSIYNLNEVFAENSTSTKDKLLINNELVGQGYGKFSLVYLLNENTNFINGPYIPEKEELFAFKKDRFYESKETKELKKFISNLKTCGIESSKHTDKKTVMTDLDNKPVAHKKLKDFCYITWGEQFEIEYNKKYSEKLKARYSRSCADKIMEKIRMDMMTRGVREFQQFFAYTFEMIQYEYGVDFTKERLEQFLNLYRVCYNSVSRWSNFGWCANELARRHPIKGPIHLEVGENIQKMIKSGEYDKKKLEEFCKERNIILSYKNPVDDKNPEGFA